MLRLTALCAGLVLLLATSSASAETRLFVIPNAPDAYGVDQCLATGARCGLPVANLYCRSREFAQAASYRKVERGEVTGTMPVADTGNAREALVAIECTR